MRPALLAGLANPSACGLRRQRRLHDIGPGGDCAAAGERVSDVYWYGNALGTYNVQSASKFRYPWTPEQLELFGRFGKYCRERYVTMVFCMNPDHYHVDWAAAKTFDGTRKDPLHYDPDHEVEPEFKQMWAQLGTTLRTISTSWQPSLASSIGSCRTSCFR